MLSESCSSSPCRSMILFTFGCVLALVLITFQYEHKLRLFNSPRFILNRSSLSLILTCGFGAGKFWISFSVVDLSLFPRMKLNFRESLQRKFFCFLIALVGVLYPMMIRNLKMIVSFHFDQSSLRKSEFCKSVVIFVGINHLCAVRCSFQALWFDRPWLTFQTRKFHSEVIFSSPWLWRYFASLFGGGSIKRCSPSFSRCSHLCF